MINFDEPKFMIGSFFWDELGYFYLEEPNINLSDQSIFTNNNAWLRLAGVLENAKKGNFNYLGMLQDYLEYDSPDLFKERCFWIMGDAGGQSEVEVLLRVMKTGENDYIKLRAC